MVRIVLPLFFLALLGTVNGQGVEPLHYTLQQYNQKTYHNDSISYTPVANDGFMEYKSGKINVKKFDKKKWKKVVGSTNYTEKKEKEAEPEKKKQLSSPSVPWNSDILRVVFYGLVASFILFIIYYVLKNTSLNFKRPVEQFTGGQAPSVENIETLEVDPLLQQAIAQGNLRLAVRLYYLALLKKLNERGVIGWKKDKTNRDYLTEIFSKEYHYNELRILTLAYEQVWYGEKTISRELFQKLAVDFENMDEQLNTVSA